MKVFLDTSVLVAAMVDQLPQHEAGLRCFTAALEEEACCSAHALAECYATLTALPLARRVQPHEAAELVSRNLSGRLKVVGLPAGEYPRLVRRLSALGLRSGVIYDAIHLACAERHGCGRLFTFNVRDFERLKPQGVEVLRA